MWLHLIPHSTRCATPCALVKRLGPQNVSISMHRGTSREYSETCKQAHGAVSPSDVESHATEGNDGISSNINPAKSTYQEMTVVSNTEMAMHNVVNDASPAMAYEKRMEEISRKVQQASHEHQEIFTKFLKQVEDDGYIAYAEGSTYDDATTQKISSVSAVGFESRPERKLDSTSMQTISESKVNRRGEAQNFADSLRHKYSPTTLEHQVVENVNSYGIQKATNESVTTCTNPNVPRRIDQSINICLHLDDKVTQEVDRIVTRFSQHRPILNNGRANIPVMKGLPAQHWRQYQIFMRFLQYWRSPFPMGRVKPLVKPLGERWGVIWQIEDAPAIQAIRQTFRQVLEGDLLQYNFPPDSPWESRATITKGISQGQAEEIVNSINTAYPDGFDLGLITRCVLIHTLFSYGRIHTTVTQSPEFLLMGIKSVGSSLDTSQHLQIESLWNQTMSQIDNTFFKTSGSDNFYKTAPIRKIQKKRKQKRKKNEQISQ